MIEELHPVFIPKLKHDWIILIDPDERITPELADSIKQTLETVPSDIAALRVPMINYFKKKPLKGTIYGGVVYARLLYRRSGVSVDNDVHRGIKLKSGYDRKRIPFTGANYDKHLWCESWSQLFDKHARYLRGEGQSRFNSGMRYSLSKQWMATITKFYYNFKGLKGYLDGWRGFCISLLQARYEFLAWRGLRKYSKKQTY